MDFSERSDEDILDNHKQEIQADSAKKYVITINKEFVPLIDSMSVEKRNEIINEIISVHNEEINEKMQIKHSMKMATITAILIIVLLFAAPFIMWLINKSYTLTRNSYNEMQRNFEVLYDKK